MRINWIATTASDLMVNWSFDKLIFVHILEYCVYKNTKPLTRKAIEFMTMWKCDTIKNRQLSTKTHRKQMISFALRISHGSSSTMAQTHTRAHAHALAHTHSANKYQHLQWTVRLLISCVYLLFVSCFFFRSLRAPLHAQRNAQHRMGAGVFKLTK